MGIPMSPEEIQELLCRMDQPKIEVVVKEENDEDFSK